MDIVVVALALIGVATVFGAAALVRICHLADALKTLVDEQNGPPRFTVRHRRQWYAAMARASELLGREKGHAYYLEELGKIGGP